METTEVWSLDISRGVPQRREKRFGNGVKNLSGSADFPEWQGIFKEKDAHKQHFHFTEKGRCLIMSMAVPPGRRSTRLLTDRGGPNDSSEHK